MRTLSTYTKLYQEFQGIEEGAYHTIIRFYEAKEKEIKQLEFDIYFDILVEYTNALFEVGAYPKHIKFADQVIALSIESNIQFYKREDIYCKSLFQKAASYYNLQEYKRAQYILRELIKISPYNELTILFLKKCFYRSQPSYIKKARAISIVFFLIAALVAAIKVIIIYPFAPGYIPFFKYLWFSLLGFGIFILSGTFCFWRYQIFKQVDHFVQQIRNTK